MLNVSCSRTTLQTSFRLVLGDRVDRSQSGTLQLFCFVPETWPRLCEVFEAPQTWETSRNSRDSLEKVCEMRKLQSLQPLALRWCFHSITKTSQNSGDKARSFRFHNTHSFKPLVARGISTSSEGTTTSSKKLLVTHSFFR